MSRKARRAAAQSESQLTIDERCNARRKAEAEAGDEFERRWKSREKEWADLKAAVEKCDTWTDGAEVACVSEVVKVARRLGLEAELGTAQERRSRLDRQDDQELAAGIFGDIIAGELKLAAKRVANQDDRSGIRHHFRFICKSVLQSLADRHAELASENPPRGFDVWSRAPYYDACRDNLIERWEKHEQRKLELDQLLRHNSDQRERQDVAIEGIDIEIMTYLHEMYPVLMKQAEIEAGTDISRKTISSRLTYLDRIGFTERPNGPNSGVKLTRKGLSFIEQRLQKDT